MKRLSLFCLFLLFTLFTMADSLTISMAKSFGLPVIEIETVNHEEPSCDYVFAPEGADGISITNATKVPGRLKIWIGDSIAFDTGDYLKSESGMTMKIRGNTSAYFNAQKPFKIKLQKKNDLLLRGDKRYNDKDWLLLPDGTAGAFNQVGSIVGDVLSMPYVPRGKYVNVFVNGDYRGIYRLNEQVGRNKDCRIDVEKNEGYIVERDSYWWNEPVYFETAGGLKYTFKYPDDDDVRQDQIDYIKERLDSFENSVANGTYDNIINVRSFATWLLSQDMLGISDAGGANLYFSLYNDTSKLEIPCMWDYDSAFRTINQWSGIHINNSFFLFPKLLENTNTTFLNTYIRVWDEIGKKGMVDIIDSLEHYKSSKEVAGIVLSQPFSLVRWGDVADGEPPMTTILDSYIDWFKQRKQWMTTAIDSLRQSTAISSATIRKHSAEGVYNLQGVRLYTLPHQKGVYIVNGKKIVVK